MSNIVGIDLGTTMSAIAYLNSIAKPEIIPNSEGERVTPSVIFFREYDNTAVIGKSAKNSAPSAPGRVAKEFKREMHNPDYRFKIDNLEYSATDLSAIILKKLVKDASQTIGEIKDVVISVPAYFKESQRNATLEAGQLAGLNVINIINEPTAAALYYASTEEVNGRGLIYDLGGGTFDITMVETKGKDINILASAGDHHLGGIDFDLALLDLLNEKYKIEKNEPLYEEEEDRQEFLLNAEELKKKLSTHPIVKEKLKGTAGSLIVEITQEDFEKKISSYVSRTELLVEQVLDESEMEASDVDYILLVGGSTRIPAIRNSIKLLIGKEPIIKVNVDEAVALGAAIKAGLVSVKNNPNSVTPNVARELNRLKVCDIANHSYGTIAVTYDADLQKESLLNNIIIHKNTSLPCSVTKTFYTIHEGQNSLNIRITQGEDADPDFVDTIHNEDMTLPPNRPEGQPIEITYSYDENQIMHCVFKDINSEHKKEVSFKISENVKKNSDLNSFLVE